MNDHLINISESIREIESQIKKKSKKKSGTLLIGITDLFSHLIKNNKKFEKYLISLDVNVKDLQKFLSEKKQSNFFLELDIENKEMNINYDDSITNLLHETQGDFLSFTELITYIYDNDSTMTDLLVSYNLNHDSIHYRIDDNVEDLEDYLEDIPVDNKNTKEPQINYCYNLNEAIKKESINPLIGREEEINQAFVVLSRKDKGTPLFVGPAGVGKTALAKGMAQAIENGTAPENCSNFIIFATSVNHILSGTKFRGDLESRLTSILNSCKTIKQKTGKQPVLYIDEFHTMIGAGATSNNSNDVSNIIKPAVADGSLKIIGCTTDEEYQKYLTKDSAVERRYTKIDIGEPSLEDTKKILEGVKFQYEKHHNVNVQEFLIDDIVDFTNRFLPNRKNPDKSIDVLDLALARAKTLNENNLKNDHMKYALSKLTNLPEKDIVLSNEMTDFSESPIMTLEHHLKENIFGQEHAIKDIVQILKISESGLMEDHLPSGIFLSAGPTGVGKTALAHEVNKHLEMKELRLDMSAYKTKHEISKLIGAPPGYAGYENGGILTDWVQKNPRSVIIFDEIEKAHEDILDILLQIAQEGELVSGQNKTVKFGGTIIFLTTNLGSTQVDKKAIGFTDTVKENKDLYKSKFLNAIESGIKSEILGRINKTIVFNPLNDKTKDLIIDKELEILKEKALFKGFKLSFHKSILDHIKTEGFNLKFGARNVSSVIRSLLTEKIANTMLENKNQIGSIKVSYNKDGVQVKFIKN